jgi:hypothetical protein
VRITSREWALSAARTLVAEPRAAPNALAPADRDLLVHASPQSTGLAAGPWCRFGFETDSAPDQRADDQRSLVFDSEPLAERIEILGAPHVILDLAVDRPAAFVAVRLCDVGLDGSSRRVSYGLLNLVHRDGAAHSAPIVPGENDVVRIELRHTAHVFQPGHRLRLAISTSYWPIVWPAPDPVTVTVRAAGSRLGLPVRPPRPEDTGLRPFEPPEGAPRSESYDSQPGGCTQRTELDANGEIVSTSWIDCDPDGKLSLSRYPEIDLEVGHGIVEKFSIAEGEPLSARAEVVHRTIRRRGSWSARVDTRTRLASTAKSFELEAQIEAFEGVRRIFARQWYVEIPRDSLETPEGR